MEIVGLIPCAGKGTRLSLPFPKEMFPDVYSNEYRPIIMYTIEAMKRAGIKHIIFTINHRKSQLIHFLGNGKQFGLNFSFCIHPEPQSLPESLNEAYHLIRGKKVFFAMPDTIINPRTFIKDIIHTHNNSDNDVTLGLFKTNNPQKFAMVDFVDEKATYAIEKPKYSTLKWMWGAMIWNPRFSENLQSYVLSSKDIQRKGELLLTASMDKLIAEGKVGVLPFINGNYRDLGTYEEIISWSKKGGIEIVDESF